MGGWICSGDVRLFRLQPHPKWSDFDLFDVSEWAVGMYIQCVVGRAHV